jgi:hypothetical protein
MPFPPLVKGGSGGWSAIYQPRLCQTGVVPGYQLRNHQREWLKYDGLFTRTLGEMCLIAHGPPPLPPLHKGGKSLRGTGRSGATKTGGIEQCCEAKYSSAPAGPRAD